MGSREVGASHIYLIKTFLGYCIGSGAENPKIICTVEAARDRISYVICITVYVGKDGSIAFPIY